MSKVIIEFNLPEEADELKMAQSASDAYFAIETFYNDSLRKRYKYDNLSESDNKLVNEIREEFINIMKEYGIDF